MSRVHTSSHAGNGLDRLRRSRRWPALMRLVLVALVAAGAASLVDTRGARAAVYNPIPANVAGDPTYDFVSNESLWAYFTSDLAGGAICVVADVTDPGQASCERPAIGTKRIIAATIGTGFTLLQGAPLSPGTYRLLSENSVGDQLALSQPFTVRACQDCPLNPDYLTVKAFKDSAKEMAHRMDATCVIHGLLEKVAGHAIDLRGIDKNITIEPGISLTYATETFALTATIVLGSWSFEIQDPATAGINKALDIMKEVACGAATMYTGIADDPPDPNYTSVATPQLFDIGPMSPDSLDASIRATDRQRADGEAALLAFERYQGALAAHDLGAEITQLLAAGEYAQDLSIDLVQSATALRRWATDADADPELAGVILSSTDEPGLAGLYARVAADGFSSDEIAQFHALGYTDDDIAAIRTHTTLGLDDVPLDTTYPDALNATADDLESQAGAAANFASEMNALAGSLGVQDRAPTASFTADPTNGATPLSVEFNNASTDPDGDALTYTWDFGDGSASTETSPTHTFTTVGDHLVSLRASDGVHTSSPANQVITVTPPGTPPNAYFEVPRYTYLVGDTIHLTDLSTDPEGPIASRVWSDYSGSFTSRTAAETDFTFTYPGTDYLGLDVTDSDGWQRSYRRQLTAFSQLPIPSAGGCEQPIAGSRPDSIGNEFMLTFMQQIGNNNLHLYIAADADTSGYVEIPGLTFKQDFTVAAGASIEVALPIEATLKGSDVVTGNGVRVCADHEISVYGGNLHLFSSDAYLGLPTDDLGTDYAVLSYPDDLTWVAPGYDLGYRSELAIAGSVDGTTVEITPSIDVGGHPAGVPFSVDLGRFMTYQLQTDAIDQDLTGTLIHSDQPIAVFSGDMCTGVPIGGDACDHIVEQMPSSANWGTEFPVISLAGRHGQDIVRVLANAAGTGVTLDGSPSVTLGPGEFKDYLFDTGTTHLIQTSRPALVGLYAESASDGGGHDNGNGDPFLTLIPPMDQYADRYDMVSIDDGRFNAYLNLVVQTADVPDCRIDGSAPAATPEPISGVDLEGLREAVSPGTHVVTCPHPFGIWAYGYFGQDSYGYPGGYRSPTSPTMGPTISSIEDVVVNEGQAVAFTAAASGGSDPFVYSLQGCPASTTIDPSSGAFAWTTTEADGPGVYPCTVTATAGDQSAHASFTITVNEVNSSPALEAIADLTVHPGDPIALTAVGHDPDLPANTLTYGLDAGPGSVDAPSGGYSWTPTVADLGDHLVTISLDDGAGGTTTTSFTIHVTKISTALTLGGDTSGQYSDHASITATLTTTEGPVAGADVIITLGTQSASSVTDPAGVASADFSLDVAPGDLAVGAAFAGTDILADTSTTGTFSVGHEDASVEYIGSTIAAVGVPTSLRAQVRDSAAAGYAGAGAETGTGASIGDITTLSVAFDVYPADTCLSGSPQQTLVAPVVDSGPTGDGIGIASMDYTGSKEGALCVVARLATGDGTSPAARYEGPPAAPEGLVIYEPSGQFVTGGGHLTAPDGARANFGFVARYNKKGAAKGQFVFITKTTYADQAALAIVKSNRLDALAFSGTEPPITATLEGKASITIVATADDRTLFSQGDATFSVTGVDAGGTSGGDDSLGLVVRDHEGALFEEVPPTALDGGNLVIHAARH